MRRSDPSDTPAESAEENYEEEKSSKSQMIDKMKKLGANSFGDNQGNIQSNQLVPQSPQRNQTGFNQPDFQGFNQNPIQNPGFPPHSNLMQGPPPPPPQVVFQQQPQYTRILII